VQLNNNLNIGAFVRNNDNKFMSPRFFHWEPEKRSRYSDWLRAGQQRIWSLSPGRGKISLTLHVVDTGSGFHPASYLSGNEDSFPEGKGAEA
jgi:hypothetical protein